MNNNITLGPDRAAVLEALAARENTTPEALLERLAPYLPLLCTLEGQCAGAYAAFSSAYEKRHGAEDAFLCSMGYRDFTGSYPGPTADSRDTLAAILTVGMMNGGCAGGDVTEAVANNSIAAVADLL